MDPRQTAIRLLARREHSRAELQQKLLARGFMQDVVTPLLNQLTEKNILSDRRFAENYIHYRTNKGYGPVRIGAELTQRGVDSDIIDELLNMQTEYWLQHIQTIKLKRFGKKIPQDFNEQTRQMRFLQYRGFTMEQIRRIFIDAES